MKPPFLGPIRLSVGSFALCMGLIFGFNTAVYGISCEQVAQKSQPGDLLFTAIDTFIYRQIATDTLSWTSHVGIVFKVDEEWVVLESKVFRAVKTSLCEFLERTKHGQFALRRRSNPLAPEEVQGLYQAAKGRLGSLYHFGFNLESDWQYGSKFVYEVFLEELDQKVGRVQTFRELWNTNRNVNLWFWRSYFFYRLGLIPWERRVITPSCQYHDPDFFTVIENVKHHPQQKTCYEVIFRKATQ